MERSLSRMDDPSPVPRGGHSERRRMLTTGLLEQKNVAPEVVTLVTNARQDAKRQEYETASMNYTRAAQLLSKDQKGPSTVQSPPLAMGRVLLELGDVAAATSSFEYAETCLKDAVLAYQRSIAFVEEEKDSKYNLDEIRHEFREGVRAYASTLAARSQAATADRAAYFVATRRAFHAYHWALQLLDPTGREVSTAVLGPLSALGQLAAHLQCFQWANQLFERNLTVKEYLGIETETVQRHLTKVQERLKKISLSKEMLQVMRTQEALEELQLAEFKDRRALELQLLRAHVRGLRAVPLRPTAAPAVPVRRVISRPSSGDSTMGLFLKTGNFSGKTPQQELDAFRADVNEGKALMKMQQLEDAQEHFTQAVELAASSFSIPLEDHRSALGNLAYVYCARAQGENEKGSREYRKMMLKSVPYFKQAIEMTEERIAKRISNLNEEISLAATYSQLGVVAVNIERLETGLYYIRKAKELRDKFNMDSSQEAQRISLVEKPVRRKDAELLAHATQLSEARKQTIAIDGTVSFHRCVSLCNSAKGLMQQRRCDEAEPLLLQAIAGFEYLMHTDPTLRRRPEYRQALVALGASYYFLGQEHGKKTAQFTINNEHALVCYHQAMALVTTTSGHENESAEDAAALSSLQFHVACCYANLRRYDIAYTYFVKCRELKCRLDLGVDDVDVNLDSLTQRLVGLIDEENVRSSSSNRHQPTPSPAQNANVNNLSFGGYSSDSEASTPTGSVREMSLNSSQMEGSPKTRRRAVSFLLPTEEEPDSMEQSIRSSEGSPTAKTSTGDFHFSSGSILVEPSFGSPKLEGRSMSPLMSQQLPPAAQAVAGAAPPPRPKSPTRPDNSQLLLQRLQRLEEMAKEIQADLTVLSNRAFHFLAQEERQARLVLFTRLDEQWRCVALLQEQQALRRIASEMFSNEERIARKRAVDEFHRSWVRMALGRIAGAEQISRQKIVVEYRRVITLPSADHQDKLTHSQEAADRSKIHSAQRVGYFLLIESHHRERLAVLEQLHRRQSLVVPKIIDLAQVSKTVMFKGSMRWVTTQWRQFIFEGETLSRFATMFRESQNFNSLVLQRRSGTHHIDEDIERREILKLQQRRFMEITESKTRHSIEVEWQTNARRNLRFAMLCNELTVKETMARREAVVVPQSIIFLSTILEPTLLAMEKESRQSIARRALAEMSEMHAQPFVTVQESLVRSRAISRFALQMMQWRMQAVLRLEDLHRRQLMTTQSVAMVDSIGLPYLVEQERIRRRLDFVVEQERVFLGITQMEQLRSRETIFFDEVARRRVVRLLRDEAMLSSAEGLESALRKAVENLEARTRTALHFQQQRAGLFVRESLMRTVGESMCAQYRLRNVMSVLAPEMLAAHFAFVACRKIKAIESHFRSMQQNMHLRSLHTVQRQGLGVLAVCTVKELFASQRREYFETIAAQHWEKMEQMNRRDISHRHREFLNLIKREERKVVYAVVEMTETSRRRTTTEIWSESLARLKTEEQSSHLTAAEATSRRKLVEQFANSFQQNISVIAQCDRLMIFESARRAKVQDLILAKRLEVTLLPYARFMCDAAAWSTTVEKLRFVEYHHRDRVELAMEEAETKLAQRSEFLLSIHSLLQRELESREAIRQQFLTPFETFFWPVMQTARYDILHKALESDELAARRRVFQQWSFSLQTVKAETVRRNLVRIEEQSAARALALHMGLTLRPIPLEEVTARRQIVANSYESFLRTLIQPSLLTLSDYQLRELKQRETLTLTEQSSWEAIEQQFYHSGRLVTMEIQELRERRAVTETWLNGLSKLQKSAFENEVNLLARREARHRAGLVMMRQRHSAYVRTLSELSWIDLEETGDFQDLMELEASERLVQQERQDRRLLYEYAEQERDRTRFDEAEHVALIDCSRVSFAMTEAASEHHREVIAQWWGQESVALQSQIDEYNALVSVVMEEESHRGTLTENAMTTLEEMVSEASASEFQLRLGELRLESRSARFVLQLQYTVEVETLSRRLQQWIAKAHLSRLLNEQSDQQRWLVVRDEQTSWSKICLSRWMITCKQQANALLRQQQLTMAELSARWDIIQDFVAAKSEREAQIESAGSELLLFLRETTRREQLQKNAYRSEVAFPLQLLYLEHVELERSLHETVYRDWEVGVEQLWTLHIATLEQRERQSLQSSFALDHQCTLEWAQVAVAIATEESCERSAITQTSHESATQLIAANVWRAVFQQVNAVATSAAILQLQQLAQSHQADWTLRAVSGTVSTMEPCGRQQLLREQHESRQALEQQRLIAEESLHRQHCQSLLQVHDLIVSEAAERVAILSEYRDGWLFIQYNGVFTAIHEVQLQVVIEEVMNRATIEKRMWHDQYGIVQRTVIMTEFVIREEVIARIQQVVEKERQAWMAMVSEQLETPPTTGRREAWGSPPSAGNGRAKLPPIQPFSRKPQQLQLPASTSLAHPPPSVVAADSSALRRPSLPPLGDLNRKKSRKHLVALAAADQSALRDALNIRPTSASMRMTPRDARRTLKPLPSALVSFRVAEVDTAVQVAQAETCAALQRLQTHESFERYTLAEDEIRHYARCCSAVLLSSFSVIVECEMDEHVELLSTAMFDLMMCF